MKKILVIVVCLVLASCSSEFKIVSEDVPPVVASAFSNKYPSAKDVEWEAEKTNGHLAFEAGFKLDGKSKEAYFTPDGQFLKEE